ncbi:hypothetical protein vBSlqSZDD2_11 [Serratia phage vB_SlqS_ZDD2]|nr:hypothetical protein vBSlqSZDD2_11 [Serratia phage vB_SlqS_ZDD2]
MATTSLKEVFVPKLYASYAKLNSLELTDFAQSGIAVTDDRFKNFAMSGGDLMIMPHWRDLDHTMEPNYSNDDPADLAVPGNVTAGEMQTRISYLNYGWSAMDLTGEIAGSSPNKRIAERVESWWQYQFQKRMLAMSVGLYNENVANHDGDMVFDATKNAGIGQRVFGGENFIDAVYTLGDRAGLIKAMAIHSSVEARMAKEGLIEYIRNSEGQLLYKSYMGKRLVVDDSMPTFGTGEDRKYLSILFSGGQFAYASGAPRVPYEVEREPRAGHGGGEETLWTRKTWLMHPYGYSFTGEQLTGTGGEGNKGNVKSATLNDLQASVNWKRVVERKGVGLAFLVTK